MSQSYLGFGVLKTKKKDSANIEERLDSESRVCEEAAALGYLRVWGVKTFRSRKSFMLSPLWTPSVYGPTSSVQ